MVARVDASVVRRIPVTEPRTAVGSRFPFWLALPAFAALTVWFFFPVAALVIRGLSSSSVPWTDPFLRRVIGFTYEQAALSAFLSSVVGTALALLYSEYRFPGRALLWRFALIPFASPTLLVALALLGLFGKSGAVGKWFPSGWIYGWPGILIGHVFLNFPLFLKGVGSALGETEREPERAALSLGASRWRCFWTITFPRVFSEWKSAFVLSFLFCSSSFLIVLFLGGGPGFTTLEVAVYQAVKIEYDLGLAVRLGAIQALVAFFAYGLFLRGSVPREAREASFPLYFVRSTWARRAYVLGWAVFLGLLVVLPVGGLLGEGLLRLGEMDVSILGPAALHSVDLALRASGLALVLAFSLAYASHRSADGWVRALGTWLAGIPLGFSTLLLTVGWLLCLKERQDWLRGSLWPAAFIQATIALPAVYRVMRDGWNRIPPELYRASASLGASPARQLSSVELPLLRRSVALALVLGLAFSLGEVGAVLLFLGQETETLPLWIFRLMGRYEFGQAYGVSLLLLTVLIALFWIVGRLEGRDERASR